MQLSRNKRIHIQIFIKKNINNNIWFISTYNEIKESINDYISKKTEERQLESSERKNGENDDIDEFFEFNYEG